MESPSCSRRIALAVEGTRGDVHPMLALAEALRDRGHTPLICAPPDFRDETESRGLEFRPVGVNIRAYLEDKADMLHRGNRAVVAEGMRLFRSNLPLQFQALCGALSDVDLVLASGTQMAASSVAELYGVPYRIVAYCPALVPSGEHPPFVARRHDRPAWVNRRLWWAMALLSNAQMRRAINAERRKIGLKPLRDVLTALLGDAPLLAADEELAPVPADSTLPIRQIGRLES
jgi:vancomycin aglycone glucosyltransferase